MEKFNDYLAHSLDDIHDGVVKSAALYSLSSGGKLIRPRLLFSVMESYGVNKEEGFNAACAIEMMHTYSLIHDDLPAMDNDNLRRGKPTCHIKFGEDMAILAGDALLTHSFLFANKASNDLKVCQACVEELGKNGGLDGMIYGQEKDIMNVDDVIDDVKELETIHFYKTGKLISLACVLGAILANKKEDVETWREFGQTLGLIFQIQDDVFGEIKSTKELGKNAKSDYIKAKSTYATLLGVKKCKELIAELHKKALALLDCLDINKEPIIEVVNILINRENRIEGL